MHSLYLSTLLRFYPLVIDEQLRVYRGSPREKFGVELVGENRGRRRHGLARRSEARVAREDSRDGERGTDGRNCGLAAYKQVHQANGGREAVTNSWRWPEANSDRGLNWFQHSGDVAVNLLKA